MEATTIAVSIEGVELADWEAAFRTGLAAQPGAAGLTVEAAVRAGMLGGRRTPSVRVSRPAGQGAGAGDVVQMLGLVLSALSLAVAAMQFGRDLARPLTPTDTPPAPAPFVCRIEGARGVQELRIAGIPSEAILRKCLDAVGTPVRVKVVPPPGR